MLLQTKEGFKKILIINAKNKMFRGDEIPSIKNTYIY